LNWCETTEESFEYGAICVDTLDEVEHIFREALLTHPTMNVPGKGFPKAIHDWGHPMTTGGVALRNLTSLIDEHVLQALMRIRKKRNIPIILTAHETIVPATKTFMNKTSERPTTDSESVSEITYDRIDIGVHRYLNEIITNLVDAKIYIHTEGTSVKCPRSFITGTPFEYAGLKVQTKNSLHLPDQIPFGYNSGYQDLLDALPKNQNLN
jgi:hypothetical protein